MNRTSRFKPRTIAEFTWFPRAAAEGVHEFRPLGAHAMPFGRIRWSGHHGTVMHCQVIGARGKILEEHRYDMQDVALLGAAVPYLETGERVLAHMDEDQRVEVMVRMGGCRTIGPRARTDSDQRCFARLVDIATAPCRLVPDAVVWTAGAACVRIGGVAWPARSVAYISGAAVDAASATRAARRAAAHLFSWPRLDWSADLPKRSVRDGPSDLDLGLDAGPLAGLWRLRGAAALWARPADEPALCLRWRDTWGRIQRRRGRPGGFAWSVCTRAMIHGQSASLNAALAQVAATVVEALSGHERLALAAAAESRRAANGAGLVAG